MESSPVNTLAGLARRLQRAIRLDGRSGYQLAVLVLIGSLLTVWLFARSAGQRERDLARADFVAEAAHVSELIVQRLLTYELTALGGVSLFASVEGPSREQWQGYVDGLRMEENPRGILGLGYAPWLTPSELTRLQLALREAGQGMYQVQPPGSRERYGPTLYLMPENDTTREEIGYDMYAEPIRRMAMNASRDSGGVHLSAPVRPVGGGNSRGLVMFAPVYAGSQVPPSLIGRRAGLRGWVYVPFEAETLAQGLLMPSLRGARMRIVDTSAGGSREIHADEDFESVNAMSRALTHVIEHEVYGRKWRLEFAGRPQFLSGMGLTAQQGTLLVGTLVSLLLFAMFWALAHTQSRAERLAERMSESWRRSNVRFRAAMQYSGIGKALLDHANRIVEVNPALTRILGGPAESLVGELFDQWLVEDPQATNVRIGTSLEKVMRTTRELRRFDGEHRHVQLTYAPVPGEIGSEVVRLVQVEDVTERQRAEARIRELNRTLESRVVKRTRELEQANRELESFAYSVSHDLRAPLRTIDGFGRMLVERYREGLDDTGRDYLGRIRAATSRMDSLIDALLTMSRLSRAELNRVPLDLGKMAEEIVAELRQSEPGRDVEVAIAADMHAHGDAALVRNLLQNLIGNAWKFTANTPHARIEAGCDQGPDGPVFFVRDNGAGFSPAYASKLFRPFQRLHGHEEFSGHGVGLASVKRVVERHGGEVSGEGEPDKGACFRFSLGRPPRA